MAGLLPTLKAMSQTGSSSLSEHVELLELVVSWFTVRWIVFGGVIG